MYRYIISHMVSREGWIGDDVHRVKFRAVDHLQPRQNVPGEHDRHALGVKEYARSMHLRVISIAQRLHHLSLANRFTFPDMCCYEDRDVFLVGPSPFEYGCHD